VVNLTNQFCKSANLMRFCFTGKPTYSPGGAKLAPETPDLQKKRSSLEGVEKLAQDYRCDALAADMLVR
jgi:hypothetical protein